jgi:hypothetical protein
MPPLVMIGGCVPNWTFCALARILWDAARARGGWRTAWSAPGAAGRGQSGAGEGRNRAHANLEQLSRRANAQFKNWHVLRKLRCWPWRAGQLAKAIHVLQAPKHEDEKTNRHVEYHML